MLGIVELTPMDEWPPNVAECCDTGPRASGEGRRQRIHFRLSTNREKRRNRRQAVFTLLLCDPARIEIPLPDGAWIASGFHAEAAERLRRDPTSERAAGLCREIGDATLIRITANAGRAVRLEAWRGATSAFEIFYSVRPDGAVLVADQFRNILAEIPVAERRPSEAAILDHFLFRTVPGVKTYVRGVERLGHGEHLVLMPATGAATTRIFDRIGREWLRGSLEEYLDRLEPAFAETVRRFAGRERLMSMFSGGVDSSLLHTYLDGDVRAVFYQPERVTPGTPDPTRYARRATDLLKLDLEVRRIPDDAIWERVEQNIEAAGWPQRVLQASMYADAFALEGQNFVLGERADALFGAAGTRAAALGARCRGRLARLGLRSLAGLHLGSVSRRAGNLRQVSREIGLPACSPEGWAARMSSRGFTDFAIIADIVGQEVLLQRMVERLSYVTARLRPPPKEADLLTRHLELAHWIDFLCEDHSSFLRQLGLAHRKSVILPFLQEPVVRQAMTVPADERYIAKGQVKHLLKGLLKRRLPAYPVHQPKGITSMMTPRRYRGMDRRMVWETFPMPDFIPVRHRQTVADFENPMSGTALRLSILERKVLRNPALAGIAGTKRIRLAL